MSVELPADLAEALADQLGIYTDPRCDVEEERDIHVHYCHCRVIWVPDVTRRIRDAVHAEDKLKS